MHGHTGVFGFLLWLFVIAFAVLAIPGVRRAALSAPVFKFVKGTLPKVSDTEAQALEAGTVGFDAELFSGTPDWDKLRSIAPIVLTPEEQAFLDGPTDELCGHDQRLAGARTSSARSPTRSGTSSSRAASSAC